MYCDLQIICVIEMVSPGFLCLFQHLKESIFFDVFQPHRDFSPAKHVDPVALGGVCSPLKPPVEASQRVYGSNPEKKKGFPGVKELAELAVCPSIWKNHEFGTRRNILNTGIFM